MRAANLTTLLTASLLPVLFAGPLLAAPKQAPTSAVLDENFRRPANDTELKRWLQNMVWHHQFTTDEIRTATGLGESQVAAALERFDIRPETRPQRPKDAPLLVLPYPGGRHPRIGFLEGALRPQRDTKVSIFTPWDLSSYLVVDIPEAIRIGGPHEQGLLYLAHTHVETLWTQRGIELEPVEWERLADGSLRTIRRLPNKVTFGAQVSPRRDGARMEVWLTNNSDDVLSQINVKNCTMLKGAPEFAAQTTENKFVEKPYVACRSSKADRWVITAWERCVKARVKAICPCMHSDPSLPDCAPGETKRIRGWFSFYEGADIQAELNRIEATGWRER